MEQGKIAVQTENIFPIIKKFLYSDHEIFLRELVSNAVDATQKIQKLSAIGKFKGELGDLTVSVSIDKKAKTLTISDNGLGMSAEEVKKYINQVAFSGAEDFLKKYEGLDDGKQIIGHFGLGFYSSFMVAEKVEIITKSYQKKKAAHWVCDGSPTFSLEDHDKKHRGTDIILHIADDSKEFLEEARIQALLDKYCKFLPLPIQFGTKTIPATEEGGAEEVLPNIINNPSPAWTKRPASLKDEDYKSFYSELYPYAEPPLFWIHLNVDHPFKLTGILYFPKIDRSYEAQKNKIQLYSNQVFVTDEVGEIVPEFLTLLHGVIDSPDIPLNVSRSYLQSDANVKKISSHISKKVAEKLGQLFKKDRTAYEEKWESIAVFVKYGMLSDEKFDAKGRDFCLLENVEGKRFTLADYQAKIEVNQKDKDDKLVVLYSNDAEHQHTYIEQAKEAGYDVLKLDQIIDNHFIQHVETKGLMNEEKVETKWTFKRVDADTLDNLVDKGESHESALNTDQEEKLKTIFEETIGEGTSVQLKPLSPNEAPVQITQPEFMRRMKEMQSLGGQEMNFPGMWNLVVNTNHPLSQKILSSRGENPKKLVKQLHDLALLSQNMLKGKELSDFVTRSVDLMN